MRAAPFLLVFLILLGGTLAAYQTLNAPPDQTEAQIERPTVTPRPRPTSPKPTATEVPTATPTPSLTPVPPSPMPTSIPTTATVPPPPPTTAVPLVSPVATVAAAPPQPSPAASQAVRQPAMPSPARTVLPNPGPFRGAPPASPGRAPARRVVPSPTAAEPPPTAAPPGIPGEQVVRIGNTGRQGAFLRRTPNMNDRIRAWRDGTPMVVLGPPVEGDGHTWLPVRAPDGAEGYLPVEFTVAGG